MSAGTNSRVSVWPVLTNFLYSLCNFASFILLSRNVIPEQFGVWVLFLAVFSVCEVILLSFTRGVLVRPFESDNRVLGYCGATVWRVLTSVWFCLSVLMWGCVFIPGIPEYWLNVLVWVPFVLFCSLGRFAASFCLQAIGKEENEKELLFVHILLFLFLSLFLLWCRELFWGRLVGSYAIASLMASGYAVYRGWCRFRSDGSLKSIRVIRVHRGFKALIVPLSDHLLRQADILMIAMSPILGPLGVAVYAVPFRILEMIGMLLRPLSGKMAEMVRNRSVELSREYLSRLWIRFVMITLIVFIPFLGFFVLFPSFPVGFLGGGQYGLYVSVMVTIVYTIVCFGFMMIPAQMSDIVLVRLGKTVFLRRKTIFMASINIVGNSVAVFLFYSLSGVAWVTLFFTLIGTAMSMTTLYRSGIRFSFIFWREEWSVLKSGIMERIVWNKN